MKFARLQRGIVLSAGLAVCLALQPRHSAAQPSIDDVLVRVSRNVQDFQDQLPDFECNERITSTSYERNGLIAVQRVIDSVFTGRQKEDGTGHSYVESRQLVKIDGIPAAPGQPMPALPFQFGGGFSASIVSTFAPEILSYRTYHVSGTANFGTTPAWIVEFATKKDQRKLQMTSKGTPFVVKDSGKAWIDPDSMQVIQLERQFTDFPNFNTFSTVVTYGETPIGGRTFWMPQTVRADAVESQHKTKVAYFAEYGQCHRYGATIELKFGDE